MDLAFTIVQASGAAFVAAVWIASVVWTARDARRRCRDRGDVRIAITTAVLLPFAGAAFYALARPCEDPLEARERKLHLRLLEATLFDPGERCLACLTPLEPDFRCCPGCGERLRTECGDCGRLLALGWNVCPWCVKRDTEPVRSVA